ncbi:hypothetical protein [Aquitalea sp. USM4]|uniref:hypothetical protein n=1 Tax=Aquitalea sp. USM4 TaxID=1590041 RepID=UPI001039EE3A|nr:hypothetical protein [Aquitalea sp. USM4]QBJ80541.1 hypothetical protein DKK66_20055 [Aquitalea sp. USM4]
MAEEISGASKAGTIHSDPSTLSDLEILLRNVALFENRVGSMFTRLKQDILALQSASKDRQ